MLNLKKVCFFYIILLTTGCTQLNQLAGLPYNEGNGYTIEHKKGIYGGGVTIQYEDNAFLREEVRQRMSNRMSSERELEQALAELPSGGRVQIHYEALTITAGNTSWLEYVLLKDGIEIYRREGTDSIANTPTNYAGGIGFWWNIDIVDLRVPFEFPIELVVINNLRSERDSFIIAKPE
jgi:hypothetical protein